MKILLAPSERKTKGGEFPPINKNSFISQPLLNSTFEEMFPQTPKFPCYKWCKVLSVEND
jgi:hypothetical protein